MRFDMISMNEILTTTNKNMSEERHPLHMRDIDPPSHGARAHLGNHVGEVSIRISGSKTAWANQGCIRPRAAIPVCSATSDICAAIALIGLQNAYHSKFAIGPIRHLGTGETDRPLLVLP